MNKGGMMAEHKQEIPKIAPVTINCRLLARDRGTKEMPVTRTVARERYEKAGEAQRDICNTSCQLSCME